MNEKERYEAPEMRDVESFEVLAGAAKDFGPNSLMPAVDDPGEEQWDRP